MRESIHALLQKFSGLEPLKRLFWSELNYDRVNQPLSTRDWTDAEKHSLIGDPLLLAEHGEFKIIYGQLAGGLEREPERVIVNRMLRAHPYALFVFSDRSQTHWHFLNVKYERDPKRRRVFRRITISPNGLHRTATERLSLLDLETISRDLFGIPPLAIQQRHDQAFDVEAVTREFFREYDKIFKRAEAHLTALPEERRRLFTQKLFNRLMFIVFLERKGWLTFDGRTDYLRALWEDYERERQIDPNLNFYWNRLYLLFFSGLNNAHNLIEGHENKWLATQIGHVPYLNGGLFEGDDDDENRSIVIPDHIFEAAITEMFYRFNFTVAESTPLDIEVAVDPEMLGKIFEELVTGRHETGSYYTPKPVVAFMCREGLKGYLRSVVDSEQPQVIARFVDEYDATKLRDPEAVLRALQRVTVCDPACGSGAYLLGMLQELLLLRQALFTARAVDQRSAYDRKLEIIQQNIYGVDKDEFAVNIAQLRLWLSLIVDFERGREGAEPPTLPNLDYKIEAGDSLLGPDPSNTQFHLSEQLVRDFADVKRTYLKAHSQEKQRLHTEAERLRAEIRQWARGGGDGMAAFDWAVEFAEVFGDGGFDIVLANPPYVRMELFKDIKPILRKNFPDTHSDRADLYTYFYARAVQMLCSGGMLVFISSNKWLRSGYGANLRKYLYETTSIQSITDFGDLPVFQSASAYPMIFVAQKTNTNRTLTVFTEVKSLTEPYPDVAVLVNQQGEQLPSDAIQGETWRLTDAASVHFLSQMDRSSVPLGKYVEGKIYWGVKTGLNTAFVIDEATRSALLAQESTSIHLIKPLALGRDIRRWRIDHPKKWLLYIHHDIDMSAYPAIINHLLPFREQLEKRATKQEWYELQQPQERYSSAFEGSKIVMPDIAKELRFAFDETGTYLGNTAYFIPTKDLYLLGVLNSTPVERFYSEISSQVRGGYLRFFRQFVEQIPIPNASAAERDAIAALAQRCVEAKGVDCTDWEREIDERVTRLYGLDTIEE